MAALGVKVFQTSFIIWFCLYNVLQLILNGLFSLFMALIIIPFIYLVLRKIALPPPSVKKADDIFKSSVFPVTYGKVSETPSVLIVGHRTCALDAPENTIAGIRKAKESGADGVEVDLRFTKDDVPVLFHDTYVNRTTNGQGFLSEFNFVELRSLDAAYHHFYSKKYANEQVPSFEEAVCECLRLNLKLFIDVKETDDKARNAVLGMYQKYPELYELGIVVSFYPLFLYQLRADDPGVVTMLTWRPYILSRETALGSLDNSIPRYTNRLTQLTAQLADVILEWLIHNVLWFVCGISGVLIHHSVVSKEYVRRWRCKGLHVMVWTVNDTVDKIFFENGLKVGYMTDTMKTCRCHLGIMTSAPRMPCDTPGRVTHQLFHCDEPSLTTECFECVESRPVTLASAAPAAAPVAVSAASSEPEEEKKKPVKKSPKASSKTKAKKKKKEVKAKPEE